ncbi:helix-turn-helix transcriptional regulator [Salmonella enterica]|nr:helix-turn-helix transcriptional regulator [Salmonella enterica]EDC7488652.1 helix-turn-helix domain-containing protein [Salmonella enterica]
MNIGCFMTQPISVIARSLVRERQRTGLSLAEIARRAGIAKSTLSQLEAGNGNPSLETLWSLCVALDIPFARLLEPQVQKTQVIRRGEGTKVVAEQAHYQAILLAACPPGARRDICLLLTQPGADRISHPHPPGSVEHIIVTQGKALVGLTEAPEELAEGDYICYPGDQAHIFKALEPDTQAILVAEQN